MARFLYSGGVNTDLGTLAGYGIGKSYAYGINDAGTITGRSYASGGYDHAFVYSAGTMTDLGTLSGWGFSQGVAINGAGRIVGSVGNVNPAASAGFVWDGTSMTQLPSLGGTSAGADDINTSGTIVGLSTIASGQYHAFKYAGGTIRTSGRCPAIQAAPRTA